MPVILKNNASSTLATEITASDTALTVADGSQFPALSPGEYFYATLVSPAGTTEIIKVTARVSNSMTVERAQDGSSAAGFLVGALVVMRVNAATVTDLVDEHDQASEISITDAGGYYTSTDVEGALQEAAQAATTQIADAGGYYTSTDVEGALQEAAQAATTQITDAGGYYTSTDVEGALQEAAQAATTQITDAGGYYTSTDVEGALQEAAQAATTQITDAGGYYTSTDVEGALQEAAQAATTIYTQDGVGAADRSVQDRLRDFVSVKDFGAVGDGVTDDTAAFTAAWAAADPHAVHVPVASYAITGTVTGSFFSFGEATIVGGTVTEILDMTNLGTVDTEVAVNRNHLAAVTVNQLNQSPHEGYADVLPTSTYPVAAVRMEENWIMVRVRSANLAASGDYYFDEFIFKNADGTFPPDDPVLGGWQLWSHRALGKERVWSWLINSRADADMTNADFAIRIGDINATYHSGGEGPEYYYRGYGHGGMFNIPADNQIFLNGGGSNLNSVSNWPVGTRIYGTSLQINEVFYLHHPSSTFSGSAQTITAITQANPAQVTVTGHGLSNGQRVKIASVVGMTELNNKTFTVTVVDANNFTIGVDSTGYTAYASAGTATQKDDVVEVNYTRIMDTNGLRMLGTFEALVADVGFQDSYCTMFPVSHYQTGAYKPGGVSAIAITADGTQKPADNSWAGAGFTATVYQAYDDSDPTMVSTMTLAYGQPIRQQGGGLAAWGLNNFGRAFFRDLTDFPKLYVFAASSEEGLPRTAWPLTVGVVYEWQNRLETYYRSGGPI